MFCRSMKMSLLLASPERLCSVEEKIRSVEEKVYSVAL